MRGKIVKGIAGFYYVAVAESGIYECRAKGIFRKLGKKPLVGDDVEIEITHEQDREGSLTEILPRKNEMIRPAAANVDQALVYFAAREPDPNYLLLDRFLLAMETKGIPCGICFNKTDLASAELLAELRERYENCGCRLFFVSVKQQEGLAGLEQYLSGKTTILAGPSGSGKSSLTNALQSGVRMETGEISRKLARGRHTTRHAELIPLKDGAFLMDTPGFSLLSNEGLPKEDLERYFAEFAPELGRCRFAGCAHMEEPDCAVKQAVSAGRIHPGRYANYRYLYEELKEQEKRRY